MKILGVDPGLRLPAAALLTGRGSSIPRLEVFDIPVVERKGRSYIDARAWHRLVRDLAPDRSYIEFSWPMPEEGVSSAGRSQRAHGVIEGALWSEIEADPVYVTGQVWKKALGLRGGRENKDESRDLIVHLFPEALRFFKRAMDHNRAEAALIAVYGAVRCDLIDLKPAEPVHG